MAPSGLRSPDDAPRPPGVGPGPSTLAGMTGGGAEGEPGAPPTPEGGGAGGGMQAMLGKTLDTVQKMQIQLTQIARQFPAAGPSLTAAGNAIQEAVKPLQDALRQIMGNPGQPEPPAPAIGG